MSWVVRFRASPMGSKCPFGNEVDFVLRKGSCVWLTGNSGAGKTTLAMYLAGLDDDASNLDVCAHCEWHPTIPIGERCGVLFQQTTLLDELTVAGNLFVALQQQSQSSSSSMKEVKHWMEAVGLDFARDAAKRPTELSGGMARRASLALQLAQKKRVIVLDEPFAGLDADAATSVAKELLRLRHRCALLLISHEPHLAKLVMNNENDQTIRLIPKQQQEQQQQTIAFHDNKILLGTTFWHRFREKLLDYFFLSLPLILLTFTACGLAIGMLSADILRRIDVTDRVLEIVDREVQPLLKMLTGDVNPFALFAVKTKVRGMLDATLPEAKAALYAIGMAKLFVLEVGPLLTGLLLCGRIGGSYAGRVATMQATSQTKLLQTLGIQPQVWSLLPALAAALLAGPLLTVIGTTLALFLGALVGQQYRIVTPTIYQQHVQQATWPPLLWLQPVNVLTHPVVFHLAKGLVFVGLAMVVAETCVRLRPNLTPRHVPHVITLSVVTGSLLVIVADWGFSQLWLLRR